jgi:hypothetical protein
MKGVAYYGQPLLRHTAVPYRNFHYLCNVNEKHMIKITITIEEVPEKKSELIVGKYLISKSNYGDAYILGIPCKIMSEPYAVKNDGYHIKVISCITGIEYEIPYSPEWLEVYDSYISVIEASESFLHRGYTIYSLPEVTRGIASQVVGKEYYPVDNSYSKLLSKRGDSWVAAKKVKIISEPYLDTTPYGEKIPFVNVRKNDGSIVKCMFTEWKLLP